MLKLSSIGLVLTCPSPMNIIVFNQAVFSAMQKQIVTATIILG